MDLNNLASYERILLAVDQKDFKHESFACPK
jgi:hypothetical protein